jgi:hypothetical protein
MVERVVLLLFYLIKKARITTTLSPPEPQTSNIDPITGCIGSVLVAIVVVVILVIFIR